MRKIALPSMGVASN